MSDSPEAGRIDAGGAAQRHVRIAGRRLPVPGSRWVRIPLGGLLVVGGVFGFLPVLGFWMAPLGLVLLSVDFPPVRRLRRRADVWVGRKLSEWRNR